MKKLMILLLCCIMALGVLCGCEKKAGNTNIIRVGVAYDATTLDAANSLEDGSGFAVKLIYEALLRSKEDVIGPGIAETWESNEDATVWTFHLRQSKFSDGSDVTAEDFKYAIIRVLTPENALGNASDENVNTILNAQKYSNGECTADEVGVKVIDAYTLEITFDAETPAAEENFIDSVYAPVKKACVEKNGIAYGSDANAIVTNGPFTVTKWEHDSAITFTKNKYYWDAENIKADVIKSVVGATGDTALDMITTDMLDACQLSDDAQLKVAVEAGFESMTVEGTTQFIHVNSAGATEETGKWLGNANFRRALNAALDREALVATVYKASTPASSLIPKSEFGVEGLFNDEYETGSWSTKQDAETAQAYMAKAMEELGVKDAAEIPTFKMLAMESVGNTDALNAIADQWNKVLGIKCELDMQTIMGMLGKVMSGNFDFWKGGNSIAQDSFDYMGDYTTADGYYGYNDETFDALYKKGLAATTTKERKDALAEIATYFTDNMMDLAIVWQGSYELHNKNLKGITVDQNDVDYRFAYFE